MIFLKSFVKLYLVTIVLGCFGQAKMVGNVVELCLPEKEKQQLQSAKTLLTAPLIVEDVLISFATMSAVSQEGAEGAERSLRGATSPEARHVTEVDQESASAAAVSLQPSANNGAYSDLAAKTVANIRRLQENVTSATVAQQPQISPGGWSGNHQVIRSKTVSIIISWFVLLTGHFLCQIPPSHLENVQQPRSADPGGRLVSPPQDEHLQQQQREAPLSSPIEVLSSPKSPRPPSVKSSRSGVCSPPPPQSPLPSISPTLASTFNALVTIDPNWQSAKRSVRERNAVMCNNALMADVYFVVGAELGETRKFPAHKYVLATGSTVFYAMFYGGLAEERDVIEVREYNKIAMYVEKVKHNMWLL